MPPPARPGRNNLTPENSGIAMTESAQTIDCLPVVAETITQQRLDAYCAAAGDYNPLHWDAAFAAETQFGGVIAHGMLTLALIARMMAAAYGRAWLESGRLQVRFKGAAYLGDRIESRGRVTERETQPGGQRITCAVSVINSDSGQELVAGTAAVKVRQG